MPEYISSDKKLSHFDAEGNARMVDVGSKADTVRQAVAAGTITLSPDAYRLVRHGGVAKGDVLAVARIAGVMAAKKTAELIPLAHPLAISSVSVDFRLDDNGSTIEIEARAGVVGKTGVEMEVLTAVSVAALTIYDMCKAVDKDMIIGNIRLLSKSGGRSGVYNRAGE